MAVECLLLEALYVLLRRSILSIYDFNTHAKLLPAAKNYKIMKSASQLLLLMRVSKVLCSEGLWPL